MTSKDRGGSARALVAILLTVLALVGALALIQRLLNTALAGLFGLILAGVASRVVEIVENALPPAPFRAARESLRARVPDFLRSRRKLFPTLPPQSRKGGHWSALASVLLLLSHGELAGIIVGMMRLANVPEPAPPAIPLVIAPLFLIQLGTTALIGYSIGRIDPVHAVSNLAVSVSVLAISLFTTVSAEAMIDMYRTMGIDPTEAPFWTFFGGFAFQILVQAAVAFYAMLWGARRGTRSLA